MPRPEAAPEPRRPTPTPHARSVTATTVVVLALLLGLPVAVGLDLRGLTQRSLEAQAREVGREIDEFRAYYAANVVGRLDPEVPTRAVHNFREVPGTIPIPATLSLELGDLISRKDGSIRYRFVSPWAFKGRKPHALDAFEKSALDRLTEDPNDSVWQVSGGLGEQTVRMATPIVMGEKCVDCHNAHPDSPRTDWAEGDVRGIQSIEIQRPIETSVLSFRYLLGYFACALALSVWFIRRERRQQAILRNLSAKLGRYLSPQLFRSIFSGEMDVDVVTARKKLTIFFSDIVDFTATTERLQPEVLTGLLNEYLTEMSAIADRYGGTIDKFIGDAIVVFFGDPETRGVQQDAVQCLRMAIEMQRRTEALAAKWRRDGVENPFRVRIGINTGFCNVGNFGSEDRVEYTIIGAEANLSARLQSVCEPGGIVLSYETYVLVRDVVHARPLAPMTVKGVHRTIVPYAVEGLVGEVGRPHEVVSQHGTGLDVFIDPAAIREQDRSRALAALRKAIAVLETPPEADPTRGAPPPPPRAPGDPAGA
jgi:class 3 adenylate cyclase